MTQEQAAFEIVKTVAETIKALGEVPSGHLYARLMNYMDFQSYERVIGTLKRIQLVEEKNHLLMWVGPKS